MTTFYDIDEANARIPEVRDLLPGNRADLRLCSFAADLEEDLERALSRRDERQPSVLPYTHDGVDAAAAFFREKLPRGEGVALVVENAELRPFVRALIEPRFAYVPVIARAELLPERQAQPAEEVVAR